MFSLFGATKKKEEPKVDVQAAQEKLHNQVENIEMRIKKLENQ